MTPLNRGESSSAPLVLVIDDEVGLRDMLAYSLPERGYEVVTVCGAEEALTQIQGRDFALAVCDIMMPGMQGVELLGALKRSRPSMEVVMATGFASLETAVSSMKLGAYDYISKPYDVDHLCAVLARALEHRRLKQEVGTLENISRLKSEFLATMSHELRTPLNAIVGYASLLVDGAFGSVNPEQKEALDCVVMGSQDLLTLINAVLDLSKINAGMMSVSKADFDLPALLEEVAASLRPLARQKNLEILVSASGGPPLRNDRPKVKQILVNLIGNAIKFTDKGSVTLSAADAAPGWVAVTVADTGPGIAAGDLPIIFDEFRQVDSSPQRAHGGTGLGLAIVKKLCALLGGDVSVQSRVGAGTVFTVRLPRGGTAPESPRG